MSTFLTKWTRDSDKDRSWNLNWKIYDGTQSCRLVVIYQESGNAECSESDGTAGGNGTHTHTHTKGNRDIYSYRWTRAWLTRCHLENNGNGIAQLASSLSVLVVVWNNHAQAPRELVGDLRARKTRSTPRAATVYRACIYYIAIAAIADGIRRVLTRRKTADCNDVETHTVLSRSTNAVRIEASYSTSTFFTLYLTLSVVLMILWKLHARRR